MKIDGDNIGMSEKDIKFDNVVKVIYPPLLYFMITLLVEVIADIYLFIKQTKSINESGASLLSSYTFFENLNKNLENYTYIITFFGALIGVIVFGILFIRECSVLDEFRYAYLCKNVKGNDFLLAGLLGFFASTGLSRFVYVLPLDNIIGNYEEVSSDLLKGNLGIQIVSLAIFVPVAEELIYRGLVFLRMKKLVEVWSAALLTSIIFGVFHFNLLQGVYTFLLSMVLITVFLKYKSIIPSIIVHSIANLTAVLSEYFGISSKISSNIIIYLAVMILELALAVVVLNGIISKGEE